MTHHDVFSVLQCFLYQTKTPPQRVFITSDEKFLHKRVWMMCIHSALQYMYSLRTEREENEQNLKEAQYGNVIGYSFFTAKRKAR